MGSYYIHCSCKLAGWLKCVLSLINTDGSIPVLKTLIPQTLPRAARRVWGPDYTRACLEEVVQVYGFCIRTLRLPVISVMIIGIMRLSYNERAVPVSEE